MLKFLGFLFILIITFGTGYYLGSNQLSEITDSLLHMKKELTSRTSTLETELNKLRLRMTLVDVRNHLEKSKEEFIQKNFGIAKREIGEAKKKAGKALKFAGKTMKEKLLHVKKKLDQLQSQVGKSQQNVVKKMDEIKQEIESYMEN